MNRIIRDIEKWWWLRCRTARLDQKAKERRNAIRMAQRSHRRTKPLYVSQFEAMTAKLRDEVRHG